MLLTPKDTKAFILFLALSPVVNPSNTFGADIAGNDAASYFRVIWGLLVVLGIILVLYGIVRKRFSLLASSPTQNITILEIKPMMGKKSLCLVDVKGQEYLLGISGDQINHIATIPAHPETSFADTLQSAGASAQS